MIANRQVIFASWQPHDGRKRFRRANKKIWRLPTLAQAIQALPSATLRLTAEFGMGSGRTTALWPPKNVLVSCPLRVVSCCTRQRFYPKCKRSSVVRNEFRSRFNRPRTTNKPCSLKTTHSKGRFVREFKSPFSSTAESLDVGRFNRSRVQRFDVSERSDQAARPISTGRLKALRLVHVQPINPVVCRGSLGTCVRETISWEELGT